jgi:hypothetical protein
MEAGGWTEVAFARLSFGGGGGGPATAAGPATTTAVAAAATAARNMGATLYRYLRRFKAHLPALVGICPPTFQLASDGRVLLGGACQPANAPTRAL